MEKTNGTYRISWNTLEHFHTEKTSDWYWIVGVITISIALISIILNNVIFAILIIVSSFALSLSASRRPEEINVGINNYGIVVGKSKYKFSDMDSFWIETRDFKDRILFKPKTMLMPFIVVFIDEVDPEEIHSILSEYLPEEEHHEPFLAKLLIYFGF